MSNATNNANRMNTEAWNTNRALCLGNKVIQAFVDKWRVYTVTDEGYDWRDNTEHDTLEAAITAALN